jgi:hypothetical protein
VNGRIVAELENGFRVAGSYPLAWNANDVSSGIYIIQMTSGSFNSIQKVMLIK